VAPAEQKVFPIRCPECPLDRWVDGIRDDVAERILTRDRIVLWHHRRLLDSLPRHYCPIRQCSAMVLLDEEIEEPQATCPMCMTIICIPCKTQWHNDLTCEEYQALPPDERSAEDRLLLQLVKEKHWRRCRCGRVIELVFGCNHMTCPCGNHFCFKCGADWNMVDYKCTRGTGCELWEDDNMLLEENQRQGANAQAPVPQAPALQDVAPPPPRVEALLAYEERHPVGEFDWILDNNVMVSQHKFTFDMVHQLNCGYCGRTFDSREALRRHLANIQRHPVYSCCGKFFRLREHYVQHRESTVRVDHNHTCVRGDDV